MPEKFRVIYIIDHDDRIIFTNDEWKQFALENDAPEMISEKVINQKFWNYLSGETIINIYQAILQRVRGGKAIKYNFRCDTPTAARILQMNITMLENETVQFETVLVQSKERALQKILDRYSPRTEEIITMCSWCNRINLSDEWHEVEEAISRLELFEQGSLPQISHGMCEDCFEIVTKEFLG
jgi:hypothetical protein